MINSTKAEEKDMDAVVPLAAKNDAMLVALTMDEAGIPETVEERLTAAEKIVSACEKFGMPLEKVYFDPLVMPVSTNTNAGTITLETLTAIKKAFPGAKTVSGLSNISFGLPNRPALNAAFLHMAIGAGLDAALVDPLDDTIMVAVRAGDVLAGKDRYCRRYMRAFRNENKEVS
jgi:5-methyltetrahydrofolate--homocysteine methyltransferase